MPFLALLLRLYSRCPTFLFLSTQLFLEILLQGDHLRLVIVSMSLLHVPFGRKSPYLFRLTRHSLFLRLDSPVQFSYLRLQATYQPGVVGLATLTPATHDKAHDESHYCSNYCRHDI